VARDSSEIRQKLEAKQGRRKNIREECGAPRRKYIAKRGIWGRIVQRKRGTNYVEGGKQQRRILGAECAQSKSNRSKERSKYNGCRQRKRGRQDLLCVWKMGPYGQKLLGKMEKGKDSRNATRVSKRQWRTVSSWLASVRGPP